MLNLGRNGLKKLPCELFDLPGLSVLDASHNGIKLVAFNQQQQAHQGQGQAQQVAGALALLNLSFNSLKELPQDLGTLTWQPADADARTALRAWLFGCWAAAGRYGPAACIMAASSTAHTCA